MPTISRPIVGGRSLGLFVFKQGKPALTSAGQGTLGLSQVPLVHRRQVTRGIEAHLSAYVSAGMTGRISRQNPWMAVDRQSDLVKAATVVFMKDNSPRIRGSYSREVLKAFASRGGTNPSVRRQATLLYEFDRVLGTKAPAKTPGAGHRELKGIHLTAKIKRQYEGGWPLFKQMLKYIKDPRELWS